MGTRINNLKLTEVVDGDTIKVEIIPGREESLRLLAVDTEESAIGSKPVTTAGLEATRLAKEYFGCDEQGFPLSDVRVDIEFDTVEPAQVCLRTHRGNFGRLLCYVYNKENGENYNIMTVREGWSPYFPKYGRSRLYHEAFLEAEAEAQSEERMIWAAERGDDSRDYGTLVPWWNLRDGVIETFRARGLQAGVLSVFQHYDAIKSAAENGDSITVLCDLVNGISETPGDGALLGVGSSTQKFDLWIPHRDGEQQPIVKLIEKRYAGGGGRGYVYISGTAVLYNGTPEIVLTCKSQIFDIPPGGTS